MKLEILHKQWQETCVYCGVLTKLNPKIKDARIGASRDHLIPTSAGGSKGRHNLVLSCKGCNERKNDFDPRIFVDLWFQLDPKALRNHIARLEAGRPPAGITDRLKAMLRPARTKKIVKH